MRARSALLLAPLCAIVATAPARALAQQGPSDISFRAEADTIELGETLTVTLNAMSDASTPQPSDPQLRVPAGWTMSGPYVSTQTRMSIINGQVSRRSGFQASWQLQPPRTGSFEVGPASYSLGGKRVAAGTVKVTVVEATGKPRVRGRQQQRRDPFASIFGFDPFGDDDDLPRRGDVADEPPPADSQLSLDAPLDPQVFLRAVVDKTSAVVGEQVTLSIYLYSQPRTLQVLDPHEPTTANFYQRLVSTGDSETHAVNVGGARWSAQLIRKIALFPLKSGDLEIGPMTLTLMGAGLRGSGLRGGLVRATRPMRVAVTEPPAGPRPAGYVLGDVGSYNLTATVEPRKVEAGGSIAVTALLKGMGSVPQQLRTPEIKGVSWLEPETRENIDASSGVVSGSRGFTYVVKLTEPGRVDLGELSVSFWNPKLKEYQTARARLGNVEVTGQAPKEPEPAESTPVDPFAGLPAARTTLGAYAPPSAPLTDAPWFWVTLLGSPALVLMLDAAARGARSALGARRARASSSEALVKQALDEASKAATSQDGKSAASAIERALVLAVESATGVKLRALMRDEIAPALEREGVSQELATGIAETLRSCDAWRFEPGAAPAGEHPVARAQSLVKQLAKHRRRA